MKLSRFFAFVFLFPVLLLAQGTAGTSAKYEYRKLIDMQTAGVLEKGYVAVTSHALPYGVVDMGLEVGVFENLSFGISYGGENIIGDSRINWYSWPGINIRYRLIDESDSMPGITLGFDSQGRGRVDKELKRFDYKADGLFATASKNFNFLGYLSLHGEINYSFDNKDGDKNPNLKVGVEKTIGKSVSFIAEYDFALNDNGELSFGAGKGYLIFGLRASLGKGLTVGIDMRNMLENKKLNSAVAERGIYLEYISPIFQ
jgi:hypothetical protein